jgi:hypothetical protein
MANPAPCNRCQQVPDADYFLTNRLDTPWPYDQSTVALCFHCFIATANDMAEGYRLAMEQLEAMEGPGVLESIEAEEGPVVPANPEPKSKSRRSEKPDAVPVAVPAAQEEQAADDLG